MQKVRLLVLMVTVLMSFEGLAQNSTGSFDFGGQSRNYRLHVPPSYNGTDAVPLIFNLHGYTSNATQQEFYSGMNAVSDTAGFIVCYPNGIGNAWNSGFTPPYFGGVDDVGFISVLIDSLSNQYNIDPARVYSCGMSNGGFMSYRLACELGNRIAAIASVTGTMTGLQLDNCAPVRPIPSLQIHGTLDQTVAYQGNALSESVDSVMQYWITANGCTQPVLLDTLPDLVLEGSTVTTQRWTNCSGGTEVYHFKVANGGHTWPGAFSIPSGITNQDINATQEIWNFFNRFTHPAPVLVGSEMAERDELLFPLVVAHPGSQLLVLTGRENDANIEIYDLRGRLLQKDLVLKGTRLEFNTFSWAEGVYTVRMESKGRWKTKRIFLAHW